MQNFVRMSKLSNIGGRASYITNSEKQEEIVCQSAPIDWKPYQDFEKANQKMEIRNNEGRELIIDIPNHWYTDLPKSELSSRVQTIVEAAIGKSTDLQWAVHWNQNRTNLHVHVIFSERQKEKNPGVWDRTIYQSKGGGVARRKSDRATDKDGKYIVLHQKGDLKGGFTAKNPEYKSKEWLAASKAKVKATMEQMGISFDRKKLLHEYHEGKGKDAPKIKAKNELIRANNDVIDRLRSKLAIPEGRLRSLALKALKEGKVIVPLDQNGQKFGCVTLKQYQEIIKSIHHDRNRPDFKPLIDAKREVLRQERAIEADRQYRAIPAIAAPQKLKTAMDKFKSAQAELSAATQEFRALPRFFVKKDRKRTAYLKIAAAEEKCSNAFAELVKHGISEYHDGIKLDIRYLDSSDMKYIQAQYEHQLDNLQSLANYEAKFHQKPDIPPTPEALEAARSRFEALMEQIPQEYRLEAEEAVLEAQNDIPEPASAKADNIQSMIEEAKEQGAAARAEQMQHHTPSKNRSDMEIPA